MPSRAARSAGGRGGRNSCKLTGMSRCSRGRLREGMTWSVLVAAFATVASVSAQPPPPAELTNTAPWRGELLEIGKGWWCTTAGLTCVRSSVECNWGARGTPCKRQRWAWAFSFFTSDTHLKRWRASVFRTREDCEATQQAVLVDVDVGTTSNVSPCTRVGDRAKLPRDGLPAGRGWWCFRYVHPAGGPDGSRCQRTIAGCEKEVARLNAEMVRPTPGPITLSQPCQRVRRAWAHTRASPSDPYPVFEILDSAEECRSILFGGSCRPAT
jgi:hypothetical protein